MSKAVNEYPPAKISHAEIPVIEIQHCVEPQVTTQFTGKPMQSDNNEATVEKLNDIKNDTEKILECLTKFSDKNKSNNTDNIKNRIKEKNQYICQ